MIHPTAIVSSEAQLASDVEVGPYAIVGAGVKLGSGCRVLARAIIEGDTIAGENNVFGYGSVIGAEPQDFAFDATKNKTGVRIGSGNVFRENVTIHRGTKDGTMTTIGDECFIMVDSHLAHNCAVGNKVIFVNGVLCAGHVTIEDGVVASGNVMIHQHVRIGRYAMLHGGGRFTKDVPPYVLAVDVDDLAGLNVVGLRRAGFSATARQEIRRAYNFMYHSDLNTSQALEAAAKETWGVEAQVFFDFFRDSKRGVSAAGLRRDNEE